MTGWSTKKNGPPYRGHAGGMYQTYLVTAPDGRQVMAEVPTAYGNQSAAVARDRAKSQLDPRPRWAK